MFLEKGEPDGGLLSCQTYWRIKSHDELELGVTQSKSKETRKYVFNCLEDIARVSHQNKLDFNPCQNLLAKKHRVARIEQPREILLRVWKILKYYFVFFNVEFFMKFII